MKPADFPASFQLMAAVQVTFLQLGFDADRLLVDFGPTRESQVLHGIVILVAADKETVLAAINCGAVASAPGEEHRTACEAQWNVFGAIWNDAAPAELSAVWRQYQPIASVTAIVDALVAQKILDATTAELRLAELTTLASGPSPVVTP